MVSDTTLMDEASERLLSKGAHDSPGLAIARTRWTFRQLVSYRPVQVMSVTMFLNS